MNCIYIHIAQYIINQYDFTKDAHWCEQIHDINDMKGLITLFNL